MQEKWDFYTARSAASSTKTRDLSNFVVNFSVGIQQLNTVILVIVGTYLIHSPDANSKITMGALIAAVILSGRALAPLAQIANLAIRFQQAKVGMQKVYKALLTEKSGSRAGQQLPESVEGELNVQQVSFKYQADMPEVLKNVSLQLKPGEKVDFG